MAEKRVKISEISFNPDNVNKGTKRGNETLKRSVEEFGFRDAGILDKNNVLVSGEHRTLAAIDTGLQDAIIIPISKDDTGKPVYLQYEDLDLEDPENIAHALGVYVNRTAQLSIDMDGSKLSALKDRGSIDLTHIFKRDEQLRLNINKEADDAPEEAQDARVEDAEILREKWGVEEGQVWKLGNHKIICGDSTDPSLYDQDVRLCVVSPPYNVGKDYERDGPSWEELIEKVFENVKLVCNVLCVNLANAKTGNDGFEDPNHVKIVNLLSPLGWQFQSMRIWNKIKLAFNQNPYWLNTYVPIDDFEYLITFFGEKENHVERLTSQEKNEWGMRGIWEFKSVTGRAVKHTAAFPVELPIRFMRMFTDKGDTVLDPFCGSGTSIIAAELLGRKAIGIEKQPRYVAVTLQRWLEFIGENPEKIK